MNPITSYLTHNNNNNNNNQNNLKKQTKNFVPAAIPAQASFTSEKDFGMLKPRQCFGGNKKNDDRPSKGTHLVWFRQDLRLHDHAPLAFSTRFAQKMIPVYCFDPRHYQQVTWAKAHVKKTGVIRANFLHQTVNNLKQNLKNSGSDLVVCVGKPEEILPKLCKQYTVDAITYHEEVAFEEKAVEKKLIEALKDSPIRLYQFWGNTMFDIDDLPWKKDDIPRVFTPFRKAVENRCKVRPVIQTPANFPAVPSEVTKTHGEAAVGLADLGFSEDEIKKAQTPDPRSSFTFRGGEEEGLARLHDYFWETNALKHYEDTRNELHGANNSSKFSPYLANGSLSPRQIFWEIKAYERERKKGPSSEKMIFELLWRDYWRFLIWKVENKIFFLNGIMDKSYINWSYTEDDFQKWTQGRTGFPLIDANMREMNETGFMSNRGRQLVANFFAKNMCQDWRRGAAYFEEKLIDHDVYCNYGNWAYQAGVGTDPRNRYFSIAIQAKKYDSAGQYVRRFVPELRKVPDKLIHTVYTLTSSERKQYEADTYPPPIIKDLDASYKAIKSEKA